MLQWKFTKTDYETIYTATYNWFNFKVYEDKEDEYETFVAEINGEEMYRWGLWECSAYCYWYADALDINE